MSTLVKPPRGSIHRSTFFQAFLDAQPPERAAEIIAAERAYDRRHTAARLAHEPIFSDYAESFFGYSDVWWRYS